MELDAAEVRSGDRVDVARDLVGLDQHAIYAARRAKLKEALLAAGFTIDHSEASLYLWATSGEDCWKTVGDLAGKGILVAPGEFYGAAGRQHVRVAFTATDERIDAAVTRLSESSTA